MTDVTQTPKTAEGTVLPRAALDLTQEQKEKVKALLMAEPCLHNARHYVNHPFHREHLTLITMANWLNEVAGKQMFTPADVEEILKEPEDPNAAKLEISPEGGNKSDWTVQASILKDALK